MPDEIESCEPHLFRQIELIQPMVVATLGNFATKLLSGKQTGITRVHGQEQRDDARRHATSCSIRSTTRRRRSTRRAMLNVLEQDFARLPELLGREVVPAPAPPGGRAARRRRSRPSSSASSRPRASVAPRGGRDGLARGDRGDRGGARARASAPATSSPSPASSAPARRPSSAAPAARSASRAA